MQFRISSDFTDRFKNERFRSRTRAVEFLKADSMIQAEAREECCSVAEYLLLNIVVLQTIRIVRCE